MSRTLADMTPTEQDLRVGTWFELLGASYLVVLASADEPYDGYATVMIPGMAKTTYTPMDTLTPRLDLPRAWTPTGEPVPGEWAEGHMWWGEDADTMETVDVVGAECLATGAMSGFGEWPEGITPGEDVPVRRFITDWEEA